jgi:hypothetical protein
LAAVTGAPAASRVTRNAPATTGTALSSISAAGVRHRGLARVSVVMAQIVPAGTGCHIGSPAAIAVSDGPPRASYYRREPGRTRLVS